MKEKIFEKIERLKKKDKKESRNNQIELENKEYDKISGGKTNE